MSRQGKPMLTVVLAVPRPEFVPSKKNGDRNEPDYPVIIIQGDQATSLSAMAQPGATLFVRGVLQTRNYTDHSTNPPKRRVAQEVLAIDARVLESPEQAREAEQHTDQLIGAHTEWTPTT